MVNNDGSNQSEQEDEIQQIFEVAEPKPKKLTLVDSKQFVKKGILHVLLFLFLVLLKVHPNN